MSAAALTAIFKVWGEAKHGVCCLLLHSVKKKFTPVPDRRPLCLEFIDVDTSMVYITVFTTSRAIFHMKFRYRSIQGLKTSVLLKTAAMSKKTELFWEKWRNLGRNDA